MHIRDETSGDWCSVSRLNREAFGGDLEGEIVARLHREDRIAVALVAEADGAILGHIVFSWLPTEIDGRAVRAVALAPMAVRPDRQRRGIGSQLVAAGLEATRKLGAEAVIVVGHPGYYPRFGFSASLAAKLASPFSGHAFMALELVPGVLAGAIGAVRYPAAFGI